MDNKNFDLGGDGAQEFQDVHDNSKFNGEQISSNESALDEIERLARGEGLKVDATVPMTLPNEDASTEELSSDKKSNEREDDIRVDSRGGLSRESLKNVEEASNKSPYDFSDDVQEMSEKYLKDIGA